MRTRILGIGARCGLILTLTVVLAAIDWSAFRLPLALAQQETAQDSPAQSETAVVLKSLQFKSDFTRSSGNPTAYLWDKSDKYARPKDPPDKVYSEPEWDRSHSYPIDHVKKVKMNLKLVFDVTSDKPGQLNYHLVGSADAGYWVFSKYGFWPGPGADLVIDNVLAEEALPDSVGILRDKQIHWTITINGENHDLGNTGPHTVYRTYATPCDGNVTVKRAEACCGWAEGKKDPEPIADAIWDAIAQPNDPPFEPGEKPLLTSDTGRCWELMDGELAGECDEQARLMNFACRLLGLTANTRLVHASTDAGAGRCLALETSNIGEYAVGLIFAADPAPGDWQNFEGCCEVAAAGRYYALWPKLKANNDYDMAKNTLIGQLGWTQWWVREVPNVGYVAVQGPVTLP
jgi:hypothetical protein